MRHCLVLLCLLALSMGCARRGDGDDPSGGDGGGVSDPARKLTLTPADAVLDTDNKNPIVIDYRVTREGQDVTNGAQLNLDDGRLGSFSGARFTASVTGAGKTVVRARYEGDAGETTLTLRARAIVITPGTPPDAPGRFGGPADPSAAPELVYPPAGALIPPNLNELEVHFRPRAATLRADGQQRPGCACRFARAGCSARR